MSTMSTKNIWGIVVMIGVVVAGVMLANWLSKQNLPKKS